jgi:hypothetical protein
MKHQVWNINPAVLRERVEKGTLFDIAQVQGVANRYYVLMEHDGSVYYVVKGPYAGPWPDLGNCEGDVFMPEETGNNNGLRTAAINSTALAAINWAVALGQEQVSYEASR